MAHESDVDHVWQLIDKIGFCMLSTHDGAAIRARPMAAHLVREENAIYFLTDSTSHKDADIARNPRAGLAFADASARKCALSASAYRPSIIASFAASSLIASAGG